MTSLMTRAGITDAERERNDRRSRLAELWFADRYGGTLATPTQDVDERWDVIVNGQRYDVKSVESGHAFVIGGTRRPAYPAPIVLVVADVCRLLGVVGTKKWAKGVPSPGWIECWFIDRTMIDSSTILPLPVGTPLGPPRPCPSCDDNHPVGTTCARGWAPWQVGFPWEED